MGNRIRPPQLAARFRVLARMASAPGPVHFDDSRVTDI
jgi:hypothetical protein